MSHHNYMGPPEDHAFQEMMLLFEDLSFPERMRRMVKGLGKPKDTGEYKFAKVQLQRLSAPIAALIVPLIALGAIMVLANIAPQVNRSFESEILEPETVEELEEEEIIEEEIIEIDPVDIEFTPDITVETPTPTPDTPLSPQPAEFDAVAIVKSPVIMKGLYGSRNPGSRGAALRQHGGTTAGELAVMRALRWLKKHQNADGSWDKTKPAMTSLATLTFLAHGELPGSSAEFGETVQKAFQWLVANQTADGLFKGRDGHNYSQPICAYALCEAYGLTKLPTLKGPATKALEVVVKGQNPSGGFNYNLIPTTRDDTSYMGWCAQALKAGYMAGLDVPGLKPAIKQAILGFKKNYAEKDEIGGFGYTGGSLTHGMTGVGALCLKLLGDTECNEVRKAMYNLKSAVVKWEPGGPFNKLYYSYYITQAKFHEGGDTWKQWNRMFSPVLVENQIIEKNAIEDAEGKLVDIGHWAPDKELSGHTDPEGRVMNTCLCALQLQVYYRYLPTFKTPEAIVEEEEVAIDTGDIPIEVEF